MATTEKTEKTEKKSSDKKSVSAKNILFLVIGLAVGLVIGFFIPGRMPDQNQSGNSGQNIAVLTEEEMTETTEATNTVTDENETSAPAATETVHQEVSGNKTYDVTEHLGTLPIHDRNAYLDMMLESTNEKEDFLNQRWELSRKFIDTKELVGASLEGFLRTPREDFCREKNVPRAYADTWMPVGYGATITDPDVVAMMTTSLDVQPEDKVLEIGTGSGYQSAILSNMSNHVYSIEIIEPLYYETNDLYKELSGEYPQYENISRKLGDGYFGWEEFAPFDKIIVTCSIDHLPPPLLQQLKPGGIMVVPLGNPSRQYIMEVKKTVNDEGKVVLKRRDVYNGLSVKFIPFRDEEGKSYSSDE